MVKPTPCPICGHLCTKHFETQDFMVLESFFYCDTCGYYMEMFSGPTREGFTVRVKKSFRLCNIKSLFTQFCLLVKHWNKAWPIIRNNASIIVRKWLGIKSPSGRY